MTLFPVKLCPVSYSEGFDDQVQFEAGRGEVMEIMETLTSPLWKATGTWRLSAVDMLTLEAFVQALRGALPFWFHSYRWRLHTAVSGGTGDGTTKAFPIPCSFERSDLATPIVYVAGVAKTYNTDCVIGHENRCLKSEDFSDTSTWYVVAGATVTRTSGITDPLGGTKAWRIETSGGSSANKLRQAPGAAATAGRLMRTVVWIKNISATATLTIKDDLGSTVTVPAGGASAPWTQAAFHTLSTGAAPTITFAGASSGVSLDFYVWRPWLAYEHAELGLPEDRWGYVPTGATAITMDSRGRAQVVFFPAASAPTAGQAVTATLAARYVHSARRVPGSPWAPQSADWNEEEVSLDLQAATEE